MEQKDGLGAGVSGVEEVEEVTVWPPAAQDGGPGLNVNGMPLGADGDLGVVADPDAGLLAPNAGPARTVGIGPQGTSLFGEGLLVGGVGCPAPFALDFVLVGVGQELVEQTVGAFRFHDAVGGPERGRALLPVVVPAFHLTFGVGRELHPVQTMQRSISRSPTRFIRGTAGDWN